MRYIAQYERLQITKSVKSILISTSHQNLEIADRRLFLKWREEVENLSHSCWLLTKNIFSLLPSKNSWCSDFVYSFTNEDFTLAGLPMPLSVFAGRSLQTNHFLSLEPPEVVIFWLYGRPPLPASDTQCKGTDTWHQNCFESSGKG